MTMQVGQSLQILHLTNWGRNKMAANFLTISKTKILIEIPLKFVPKDANNNIPGLVQARRQAISWNNDD